MHVQACYKDKFCIHLGTFWYSLQYTYHIICFIVDNLVDFILISGLRVRDPTFNQAWYEEIVLYPN